MQAAMRPLVVIFVDEVGDRVKKSIVVRERVKMVKLIHEGGGEIKYLFFLACFL